MATIWSFLFTAVLFHSGTASHGSSEIIKTPIGDIEGVVRTSRDGREYSAWTKIPYAKPPVGPLRLAAPVPAEPWEGVLKATGEMPRCPQLSFVFSQVVGTEDCLYLSIYKPNVQTENLPVVFYVHGGAYCLGHPGEAESADYFMDEDVILVTFTYRIGALGFMALDDLELPGNFGLKDQAAALRWVHNNIASFGGDPNSITVMGESAGGASAHYLSLSPISRDMVSKAVVFSGTVNKVWSRIQPKFIKHTTEKLINKLGCDSKSTKDQVDCLRKIEDPKDFLKATSEIAPGFMTIVFGPTTEPASPEAFQAEDLTEAKSNKPIIATFAAGEHLLFEIPEKMNGGSSSKIAAQDLSKYAEGIFNKIFVCPERRKAAGAKVKARYLNTKKEIPELIHDMSMIFEDMSFVYPALDLADTHQGPKWVYYLEHRGEISLFDFMGRMNTTVASHGDEIVILFNNRGRYKLAKPEAEPNDVRVSKEMVQMIASFAESGNPTPEGSWKPYNGQEILRITSNGSRMADEKFVEEKKEITNFWRGIFNEDFKSVT